MHAVVNSHSVHVLQFLFTNHLMLIYKKVAPRVFQDAGAVEDGQLNHIPAL